jgi:anhydro-N-acetylmuramic acid kinase
VGTPAYCSPEQAGGEGAPFAPLYHAALASNLERPLAVLNLGGVGNVTWIGPATADGMPALLAFDKLRPPA